MGSATSAVENPDSAKENRCWKVWDFKDKYGMVLPYFQKFEFEDNEDFDPKEYCDTDDEEDRYEVANPRETLLKYVKQIRDSFGFDVDCIDLSVADKINLDSIVDGANFAIKEINDETNETYALMEVEKAVMTRNWILLLTLSTKKVVGTGNTNADAATETIQAMICEDMDGSFELEQWRIKP